MKAIALTICYLIAGIVAESQSQLWQGHDVNPSTYATFQVQTCRVHVHVRARDGCLCASVPGDSPRRVVRAMDCLIVRPLSHPQRRSAV